ncbi:MAG: sensor histidine kinase [Mangrovibacterium sp.]
MQRLILLLLLSSNMLLLFGGNNRYSVHKLAEEQVQARFLYDNAPLRYYSNILIQLSGNPSEEDSLIMTELVDSLNMLVDKWDVYLIPEGTSNLDVEIHDHWSDDDECRIIEQGENPRQIVKRTVVLNIPEEAGFTERKKLIYFYVLRALVKPKAGNGDPDSISGSVFSENDPQKMTFHPVDFAIIKELYSRKYEDNNASSSRKMSPGILKSYSLRILVNLFALLFSLSFLIFMSLLGKFREHNYSFVPFLKQGLLVVTGGLIYIMVILLASVSNAPGISNSFSVVFVIIVAHFSIGLIVSSLIFLIERAVLTRSRNVYLEVIVPFLTVVLIVPIFILLSAFLIPIDKPSFSIYFSAEAGALLYVLLMGFGRSIFIFNRKKSECIIRKKDLELAKVNELHKQAELQSLRAKINPHFLYNALNSIASLATADASKAEQMALALSDFFRYAINREQKSFNTLSEELTAIRTYLEIEKVRFGERLHFDIECPSRLMETQIPQLLIQPLVENAIKHGLSILTGNGLIRIVVTEVHNLLIVRVADNGPAFPDGPLSGYGIRNTQERISLLYGEEASITWKNGEDKYIEIQLPAN